jgi:TolB protein
MLASCITEDFEDPCFICPIDFSLIDYEPAWSPNGEWIAFVHADSAPGKSGIYLVSPDGQKIQQWHEQFAEGPARSPDGQWIAFSQNAQIWKKKIDGDSLEQLTFEVRNFFPAWSPDGLWIAFDAFIKDKTSLYAVWKMESNGDNKTLIANTPEEGAVRMPYWLNNKIIHIRYLKGVYSSEVFSMGHDGENLKRLTYNEATDYYPKLSRNTGKIVFSSQPGDGWPQIWTINADGSDLKQLTDTQGYSCDWSPDGNYIVYTDSRGENGRLWIMDADGNNKRQLTFDDHF